MLEEKINDLAKRKVARILKEIDGKYHLDDNTRQFLKSEIYGYKNDILMYVNNMTGNIQDEEENFNR